MVHKPLHPPKSVPYRSPNHTYIVAYKIHVVNEGRYETSQDLPMKKTIDVALEDMKGLRVLGTVWVVEVPGYSPSRLRGLLGEYLGCGDELLIAPLSRPDRVTGLEIEEALEILAEWSSAIGP